MHYRSAGIWPDVDPNMRLTLIDDVRYAYIKHSYSAQRMDSGLGGSMLPVFYAAPTRLAEMIVTHCVLAAYMYAVIRMSASVIKLYMRL